MKVMKVIIKTEKVIIYYLRTRKHDGEWKWLTDKATNETLIRIGFNRIITHDC